MPPSFFDADFRYLDDPKNTQHDFFAPIHRVHLGDNWLFNTGGEFRLQLKNEHNSRLTGNDNRYDLLRVPPYADLWCGDLFRVYAEFIYPQTFNRGPAPLPTDGKRPYI